MSLPDKAVKRPIATLAIVLLILVIGAVSLWKSTLDLLPDIQPPLIAVITVFPGSSPQETLSLVTEQIEEQAAAIGGLTNLSSLSQENLSLVVLKFHWGSDLNSLRDEVSARLDMLSFPNGVRRPIIVKFDPTLLPVMQVAVSSGQEITALTDWLNREVKSRLEKIQGVASVQVQGGVRQDLFVRLDQGRINEHQVTFDQVANVLRASLLDIPAGITEIDQQQIRLRFLGRPAAVEDLAKLVVGFQVDEEALQKLIGQSININLNQYLSEEMPSLEAADIPMRPVYLGEITRRVAVDRENNALMLYPDLKLMERWELSPEQLVQLLPAHLSAAYEDGFIIIPYTEESQVDWHNLKATPITYIPDFAEWMNQIQAKADQELAEASKDIEKSLTQMATAMILASSRPGGGLQEMDNGSPLIPVYLDSIAEVQVDQHRAGTLNRINGQPSVGLMIQKEGEANTVLVSRLVREELKALAEEETGLHHNVSFISTFDQAQDIENALADVAWALLGGSLLAVGVLLVFLRSWRTVAIIGLSIPIAVIATFSIFYFSNITLNLMTLGALALAAGMLVDNAIVVSENIYRHFQAGASPADAALKGSKEVAGAILASTLTTVSVFFPVVFLSGLAGELFRDFALTVSSALLASLVIALTVVPLLASRFLYRGKTRGPAVPRMNVYRAVLKRILSYPWAAVAAGLVFISLGILLYPLLGTNLFPAPEESSFSLDVTLPPGTTLDNTDRYITGLEEILTAHEGVSFFTSRVGETQFFGLPIEGGIANQARIRVRVYPDQKERIGAIAAEVQEQARSLPGEGEVSVTRESILDITGLETKLELVIEGENMETVNELAAALVDRLNGLTSVGNVRSVLEQTRPEIHVHLDHYRAMQKGVTIYQIATVMRQALEGLPVARVDSGNGILDLILGYRENEIATLDDLVNIGFYSPSGSFIRLGEVAAFTRGDGPSSIPRENQRIVGIVEAQYQGDLGAVTREAMQSVAEMELPPGYQVRATGTASLMREVFDELELVLILAALLVYLVMAAQFESLLYPLIIVGSLPLAFTGAILALLLTGNSLSVPALIGAVVLAGILVNDGIIMVDLINQKRRLHGLPLREAIVEGAVARMRPILMTTITTILGLVPLALGFGEGSQLQAPMAVVIIGGQITGTVLLLMIIPAVYVLVTKEKPA